MNYPSSFLHLLTNIPNQWIKSILNSLNDKKALILQNDILQKELFIKNSELLLIKYYKQENFKLRRLLSAPLFYNEKKMLTQIINKKINTYTSQIIIDKGSDDGVYIGQPIINDQGIIGQVIATNKITSQVLLICDISHALPVQILRNNNRMILQGNGYKNNLQLKYFSNNNDIKIGDILITSGLGGRFPIGYPVAIVSSSTMNYKTGYIEAQASPIAQLNRLSYLLLIWHTKKDNKIYESADSVHQLSNKRINLYKNTL